MLVAVAAGVLEGQGVGVARSGCTVAVRLATASTVDVIVGTTVVGTAVTTGGVAVEASVAVDASASVAAGSADPQMASKLTAGGIEVVSPHIQPSTSPGETWRIAAPMLAYPQEPSGLRWK